MVFVLIVEPSATQVVPAASDVQPTTTVVDANTSADSASGIVIQRESSISSG